MLMGIFFFLKWHKPAEYHQSWIISILLLVLRENVCVGLTYVDFLYEGKEIQFVNRMIIIVQYC